MPGGDRTGPMGAGPMTGRAGGFCAGFNAPGFANFGFGGRGRGLGRGMGGRGRGFGRGFGWGAGAAFAPYYSPAGTMDPKQESEYLKNEVQMMEQEIKDINNRIKEIEK